MNRLILIALGMSVLPLHAYATSSGLNGTVWRTIDDQTNEPKAIVKFNERSDGTLSAKIQKVLHKNEGNKCTKCEGQFHNKPLVGVTIVNNLKDAGNNKYEDGSIVDPQTGKTYNFSATLSPDGKTLSGRGYIGISAIGKSQTWQRVR